MSYEYTHVFLFNINNLKQRIPVIEAKRFLDDNEQKKLSLIKSAARAQEFVYGRYLGKKIIASYLDLPINDVIFLEDSRSKLYVKNHQHNLEFNLSHSGDFVALVIADKPVGIDIECTNGASLPDIKSISLEQFLLHESDAVQHAHNEAEAFFLFYQFWTCKEAALKAIGVGLYQPMQNVNCADLLQGSSIRLENKDAAHSVKAWHHFSPDMPHLAVAKCGDFGELHFYTGKAAIDRLFSKHVDSFISFIP